MSDSTAESGLRDFEEILMAQGFVMQQYDVTSLRALDLLAEASVRLQMNARAVARYVLNHRELP